MGTLAGILKNLSQIFTDIPQPLKYSLLFSFLVLPYLPHPKPRPQLPPLPQGVERIYVTAGDGKGALEVLVAKPTGGSEEKGLAPLLFVHGGYGSAFCWRNWLPYFANKGRTVYAVSLSGRLRLLLLRDFCLRLSFMKGMDTRPALPFTPSDQNRTLQVTSSQFSITSVQRKGIPFRLS